MWRLIFLMVNLIQRAITRVYTVHHFRVAAASVEMKLETEGASRAVYSGAEPSWGEH